MKTRKVWLFSAHILPLLARLCAAPHATLLTINTFSMGLTGAGITTFLLSNLFLPYRLAKAAYSELLQLEVLLFWNPLFIYMYTHTSRLSDEVVDAYVLTMWMVWFDLLSVMVFFYTLHHATDFLLRWSSCTDFWLWESLCGTSLPSQCSSVSSGLFCLSSSCAQTPCLPMPQQAIRESCSSCSQGVMWLCGFNMCILVLCVFCTWCYTHCIFVYNLVFSLVYLLNLAVSLNVVPHRTLFWVWPSWCPISLLDCSTYASSTWEVTQLFRMRTSCTGKTLSPALCHH